jgi:hypothetical protein
MVSGVRQQGSPHAPNVPDWAAGRSLRDVRGGLVVLVLAVLGLAAAPANGAPSYSVGAARVETTPPAYSPTQDAAAFPGCDTSTFNGPRQFAFEEPYTDTDGSGSFSYPASEGGLTPEPFCDANGNGRWDGIYISGGVDHLAMDVHDPLDARAVAISDGTRSVVVVSVVAQGIFQDYIDEMRKEARARRPGITDLIVSSDHNESSPDTIGIYGAPPAPDDVPVLGGAVGLNSGIDSYYMDYLDHQVATAAVRAYDARRPATLFERDFNTPDDVKVHLSNNFPTTNDDGTAAAIDPKIRVLQARSGSGKPIATIMNLAAHNQEIGHSSNPALQDDLSADWPGEFSAKLEDLEGGMAMFLVGDNGSEEDPQTVPPVDSSAGPDCPDGCYAQADATGKAFAADVHAQLKKARPLPSGRVDATRRVFFVPLENNLFKAAAAAGLFGEKRSLYTDGQPTGHTGTDLRTEVGVVDVGPGLQMIANPGEAFPALMLGSFWGVEAASCPERPNPPVPAWHAAATHRMEVGLADDMIGYQSPAWSYTSLPGALNYGSAPATCADDADDRDPQGHQHKLETEGAGPSAGNLVAQHLAQILDRHPDPLAHVRLGRYVYADGSLSRRPRRAAPGGGAESAVAIWLAKRGTTALTPNTGRIVAIDGVAAFGSRRVHYRGDFMDYDGATHPVPSITTRGMEVVRRNAPFARYYLNVYPALDETPLGPERVRAHGAATQPGDARRR